MADVIAYNGSDKWKQKATDLLNQGGGGGGLVDDVMVNGVSVVDSDKVAQIDLTPYAETSDLATVATTGDYDDLQNKPTIPAAQVQSDWNEADSSAVDYIKNKPNLATVATSGSYTDLSNKPTIPSAQVNSDWNASSGVAEILNKPNLATVATTGDYDDLQNKPTIPAAQVQSDWTESDNTKKSYIKNKPNLATVATSGSYTDLSNKPTIPTVNDGTLTLKNGDQTKGTFSANQSTAANVVMLPFDVVGNTTIGFTPVYPS